jgi:hypothetical protein
MEFSAWADFLIKIICACYCIDPIEINFKYGNQGAQKSMFEGASRAKAQESRERGLKPVLKLIGRELDRTFIWPHSEEFTMEFVGLEAQTSKELADLTTQRLRTMYTINEVRAENDLPPNPDGDVILDANWMNARSQRIQREQQQQQQAQDAMMAQVPAPTGTDELHGMLAQLQGAAKTEPKTQGAGPSPKTKTATKTAGAPERPKAGQAASIPAQTDKQIRNEMLGEGGGLEQSLESTPLTKSLVYEVEL